MLDPSLFRSDKYHIKKQLEKRAFAFDATVYVALENKRKTIQRNTQELQSQRNSHSKVIGQAKAKGLPMQPLLEEAQELSNKLKHAERELKEIQLNLENLLLEMPNILDDVVPVGKSADDNQEIYLWGELPKFDFEPKDHISLGEKLAGINFEAGAKIAGARFTVLTGKIAQLQRALIQFMLNTHSNDHGYIETYVPLLANEQALCGTGQLPKFAQDLFKVVHNPSLYLIPTAEVPVTNIVRESIVAAEQMPLKFVCHSPCFRSEAGSYGKDVKGLIRQHQFEKVELVQIVSATESRRAHESLTADAEQILKKLNLAYRKVLLCSGDTGFAARKTYDLEVWLPSQQKYREISSCSNFGDFQARRLKARWRNPNTAKPELVHTINGSGLAAGRTLIAVMENYQDAQGAIHVPEVLQSYMGGVKIIAQDLG